MEKDGTKTVKSLERCMRVTMRNNMIKDRIRTIQLALSVCLACLSMVSAKISAVADIGARPNIIWL